RGYSYRFECRSLDWSRIMFALGAAARTFAVSSWRAPIRRRFNAATSESRSPLATILTPADVLLDVEVATKDEALREAARFVGGRHGFSAAAIHARLMARERIGSTALGYAVAVPHAHVDGVVRPIAAFIRTRTEIPFDAPDNAGVTDMLVLIV